MHEKSSQEKKRHENRPIESDKTLLLSYIYSKKRQENFHTESAKTLLLAYNKNRYGYIGQDISSKKKASRK